MKLSNAFALLAILPFVNQVSAGIFARDGNNKNNNNNGGNNNNDTDTGGNNGANDDGNQDTQTSLTLDPRVIAKGFANDGQDTPTEGQVASLTSTNNFINFCLTVPDLPITDGKQIKTGSCNPAPIGVIPSTDNMPSSKFTFPQNGATISSDQAFTISMAIENLQTGAFVNAEENYFAAPQQLNDQGAIVGHSHVVVELLNSLDQTAPTDPKKFAFFKGLDTAATNGVLTADVANGLPTGPYRLCSINTAANHQPAIVPVAQHGSLDDCVYFTAAAGGAASNNTSTDDADDANSNAVDSAANGNNNPDKGVAGGAANGGTGAANNGTATGDADNTSDIDNTGNTGSRNGRGRGGRNHGGRGRRFSFTREH